jgi:hypothetical protein
MIIEQLLDRPSDLGSRLGRDGSIGQKRNRGACQKHEAKGNGGLFAHGVDFHFSSGWAFGAPVLYQ